MALTWNSREDGAREAARKIEALGRRVVAPQADVTHPVACTRVVAFLVSDDASYLTRRTLIVDGGLWSGKVAAPLRLPGRDPGRPRRGP